MAMQSHLGLKFEGRLHSGIDDCRNNIDIFPENYAGVIFFSQEHFGCDEESCGQGSQAVQQWNDQEVKINFNYVCIIECCLRPVLSKNSTVLFNVMQKERQVGIWVESKSSLSSRGSIFGFLLLCAGISWLKT